MEGEKRATADFDAKAKNWDADPRKVERAEAVAREIRSRVALHPQMRALEYGCGTGLLSFALRPYLGQVTLADSSPGMLAVLQQKLASGRFATMTPVRLDLLQDPLPASRFDLIYTLMTLHHLGDPAPVLGKFFHLLNPGGVLCIADLDREDGSFHGAGFTGPHGFDRQELAGLVRRAGFAPPTFSTPYQVQREVAGRQCSFPLFLLVAQRP